jgi:hypothetical protein
VSDVAPGLSRALGAVHGRALSCGLAAEAEAAEAGQRRHVARVQDRMQADPATLGDAFDSADAAAPTRPCTPEEQAEIQRGLADLLASIDAFHEGIAAVE